MRAHETPFWVVQQDDFVELPRLAGHAVLLRMKQDSPHFAQVASCHLGRGDELVYQEGVYFAGAATSEVL
jgi:hypothetical protein